MLAKKTLIIITLLISMSSQADKICRLGCKGEEVISPTHPDYYCTNQPSKCDSTCEASEKPSDGTAICGIATYTCDGGKWVQGNVWLCNTSQFKPGFRK